MMFEVPLSPEAIRVLREMAQKTGVTPEEFARRAILERMGDTEDASSPTNAFVPAKAR